MTGRLPFQRAWRKVRALRLPRPDRKWLPRSRVGLGFTAVLAVATVGALLWSASRSPLFDVDHVEVQGGFLVSAAEATAAAGPLERVPLAGIDTAGTAARVEALPFVASARVERIFPNRVRISLTERMPVAFATRPAPPGTPVAFALLDATGRVLADRPDRPTDLPEVTGAGEVPAPGAWLSPARPALEVFGALPDPLRRATSAAVVEGELVTLRMGNRDVRFGRAEDLEAKVASLGALLSHLGDRPVLAIDVRVAGAPVVLPAGPPPPPPAAATAAPPPRD